MQLQQKKEASPTIYTKSVVDPNLYDKGKRMQDLTKKYMI